MDPVQAAKKLIDSLMEEDETVLQEAYDNEEENDEEEEEGEEEETETENKSTSPAPKSAGTTNQASVAMKPTAFVPTTDTVTICSGNSVDFSLSSNVPSSINW